MSEEFVNNYIKMFKTIRFYFVTVSQCQYIHMSKITSCNKDKKITLEDLVP